MLVQIEPGVVVNTNCIQSVKYEMRTVSNTIVIMLVSGARKHICEESFGQSALDFFKKFVDKLNDADRTFIYLNPSLVVNSEYIQSMKLFIYDKSTINVTLTSGATVGIDLQMDEDSNPLDAFKNFIDKLNYSGHNHSHIKSASKQ